MDGKPDEFATSGVADWSKQMNIATSGVADWSNQMDTATSGVADWSKHWTLQLVVWPTGRSTGHCN